MVVPWIVGVLLLAALASYVLVGLAARHGGSLGAVDVPREVTVSVRVEKAGNLGVPAVFRAKGSATATVPVRFLVADGPRPGGASLEPLSSQTARAVRFAESLDVLAVTDVGGQFAGGRGMFDAIRSIVHPALTAPGAPGRSAAFKAGTAGRLTDTLRSYFEGWTDSEELVSADGHLRGAYRARAEVVGIAPAFPVDEMFSRHYRQSDRQRSVELSRGTGGEVGLGPAVGFGLMSGGPHARVAVRPGLMSATSRTVASTSVVATAAGPQITGGRIVYRARVRIWAEGTGARSSAMRSCCGSRNDSLRIRLREERNLLQSEPHFRNWAANASGSRE